MASIALTDSGLRAVKRALVSHFPNEKSSHLSEALAAAYGFRTLAALLAAIRESDVNDPNFVLLDEFAFHARRNELTGKSAAFDDRRMLFDALPIDLGGNVIKTRPTKIHKVDYSKSPRLRAWRNAVVAGINVSLSRRFFSLRPGDNRWPGHDDSHDQKKRHVFHFEIEGIPAIASLRDTRWDEISISVALWLTNDAERWVVSPNAGFLARDLLASGMLERRNGAWLQVSSSSAKGWGFYCRKHRLAEASALQIRPAGYGV